MTVVSAATPTANGKAGTRLAGSISNPKKKKNIAANRSLRGLTRRCACSATEPDRAMSTRNAPMACRNLESLYHTSHQQHGTKDRQQNDFVRFVGDKSAWPRSAPVLSRIGLHLNLTSLECVEYRIPCIYTNFLESKLFTHSI